MLQKFSLIIQARTGSSRLPGKMILPFYKGKTIPEIMIDRLLLHFPGYPIYVATTDSDRDNGLVKVLSEVPIKIFRGEENNVIKRFVDCGNENNIDRFIRICGDNPFLDMGLLKKLILNYLPELDYFSYKIDDLPAMKTSFGFFAEISRISSLQRVIELTDNPIYLEHVTNFIYENPTIFNVEFLNADQVIKDYKDVRYTVDTQNDFDVAKRVFTSLYSQNPDFNFEDAISWGVRNNLLEQMKLETSNNRK